MSDLRKNNYAQGRKHDGNGKTLEAAPKVFFVKINGSKKTISLRIYKEFFGAKGEKSVQKRTSAVCEESTSQKPMKQMNLEQFRQIEQWPNNHSKSKKIDELILRFICLSCEPLLLPEKNGFADIFLEVCPKSVY